MKNVNVCARSLNNWVLGILKDCRISKRHLRWAQCPNCGGKQGWNKVQR